MAYAEILNSHNLTAEQWDDMLYKEYIGQLNWKKFMGTSTDSIIQVKEDLKKGKGDKITLGIRGQMQGGTVLGNATGIGNEGSVDFYDFAITIDNIRHLVKAQDIPMSEQRVPWDFLQNVREAVEEKAQIYSDDKITTQLSSTTNGRVRSRYLYGAADSNWNATHATGLTNIDNTADQLTTNILRIAKRKALIPGTGADGVKMRPTKVVNGKAYEEWYVAICHPYCTRDLFDNDAAWKNAQLNIPPNSNRESPIFTGSAFKGAYDGILIHEYDRINLVSSTIQVAHNFLLGAQAAAMVWGQRPKFGEEFSDLGHAVSYEIHEISHVNKIYFTRTSEADHGVVHVFAAAVAD